MALQPTRIICAIDFSSLTSQTVHFAAKMAQTLRAELFLFHAVFYAEGPVNDGEFTSRAYQWRVTAPKHIDTLKKLMSGWDVTWRPLFSEGEPVEELEKAVRRYHIDWAIAASHEISTPKRMFIGTVVERMARRLAIPLVIMPNTDRATSTKELPTQFRRVLVACSATPNDHPLMEVALFFALRFQAQLHLCHAAPSPMIEKVIDPTQGPYEEVQATLQKRLQEQLMQHFDHTGEPVVTPGWSIIPASPQEALRNCVRQFQPDLIIVGVKPEGVIKKRLIGSTTESVLRHAKTTTLIVPLSKTAQPQSES